jgi:hypothetical protein
VNDFVAATDDETAEVKSTVGWLERYCQEAAAFAQHCITTPRPGSTAASEMTENSGCTTYSMGMMYVEAGLDYLLTLLQTFRGGVIPNYAGYALARGCVEAAARAAWLFDPSLATRERLARGLLERIDSLENQYKVNRDRDHLAQRIADVQRTATHHGIALAKKKRAFCVDGVGRPTTTELVQDLLRGMSGLPDTEYWFFALLCGFTHSAGYATILNAQLGQRDAAGWTYAEITVNMSWLAGSVLTSGRLHAEALRRLGQLTGHSGAPVPVGDSTSS